jgi:tetratricopeptide (TPR) repeat protein
VTSETDVGRQSIRVLAQDALRLAQDQPAQATELASAARDLADQAGDPETEVVAVQALGLAARAMGDLGGAVQYFRAAIALGDRAGLLVPAAQVRLSLGAALSVQGDTQGALRVLDQAAPALHRVDRARLTAQRAVILNRLGRTEEALSGYRRALEVLLREGDHEWAANVLNNRGLLYVYAGLFRKADTDLLRAEHLYEDLGLASVAAVSCHNRGFSAARRGDAPNALALYDDAAEQLRKAGVPIGALALDRCEVLLAVGLVSEARVLADETAATLRRDNMATDLAEALLLCSHAALLDGDATAAQASAAEALQLFADQERPGWLDLARYAVVRAGWAAGDHSPAALETARRTADELQSIGLQAAAVDARIIAGRIALEGGQTEVARAELAAASRGRRRGTADLRARAWHAEALVRLAEGDRRGADVALRAGLRVVESQRASLGASELRSYLSTHVREAASLGLQLALETGRVGPVFAWMERLRANALLHPPVRPPDDSALATELAELRQVVSDTREAALEGRDTRPTLQRQAELEAAIRHRSLRRAGRTDASSRAGSKTPVLADLHAALAGRALVELAGCDGTLHAVVLAGGRARLHRLGPIAAVDAEFTQLRFALRRLTFRAGSAQAQAAALDSLRVSASRIDQLVLEPVRATVGDRSAVIVPTGELHALPWSLLPSCADRPLVVAPSATLWYRAATTGPGGKDARPPVLVAGPGLPDAEREISALARRYPGAIRLTGSHATAPAVSHALSGAGLAHVAAHGSFRADNPLFSSILLADGPLNVYDLERLRRAPEQLILSACQSGLSAVRPGDELMGLAAALFTLGTRTLVASVIPVPDAATRPLMLAYHRHLATGAAPCEALAKAQAAASHTDDPAALAASAGFVCFGAG